jgi:hypothetical protein
MTAHAYGETAAARFEVFDFAAVLFTTQRERWTGHARAGLENKRVPTWTECHAKSRETRLRRERDGRV